MPNIDIFVSSDVQTCEMQILGISRHWSTRYVNCLLMYLL